MKKTLDIDVVLNNGVKMPLVGLGTYKITDPIIGQQAITHAINFGYRMIDTADIYGNAAIVKDAIAKSNKKREDLFIISKIWNKDQKHDDTIKAFNRLLAELDMTYLDLVLVHWPAMSGNECYHALEELYEQKKIRAIGVSNYLEKDLETLILESKYPPMVDEVELHPQLVLSSLQQLAKKNKIQVVSWQTIMRGQVSEIPLIVDLAQKYGVDPAAIALKWAVQQGITAIAKSVTPSRIESNASALDLFTLTDEEIAKINDLGPELRLGADPLTYDKK